VVITVGRLLALLEEAAAIGDEYRSHPPRERHGTDHSNDFVVCATWQAEL